MTGRAYLRFDRQRHIHLDEDEEVEAIAGLKALSDGPTVLGATTSFAASVDEGANVTDAWDFGNGALGSGANVTHRCITTEGIRHVTTGL